MSRKITKNLFLKLNNKFKYKDKIKLLILPTIITLILINAIPLLLLIYMAFTNWDNSLAFSWKNFMGLDNFKYILTNDRFWQSGVTTLIWIVGSLALELPLGLGIALLLKRASKRNLLFLSLTKNVIVLPLVIAPIVVGVMWRFMMFNANTGVINYFFRLVGLSPIEWLGKEWALFSVILTDVWEHTPLFVLILFAGLQSLPDHLYEAARVDGANGFQLFKNITLPLLKPIIYVVIVVRSIDLMRWIVTIFIMTGGGPGMKTEIWNLYLYQLTFTRFNVSKGSAMALILIFASMLISILFVKMSLKEE